MKVIIVYILSVRRPFFFIAARTRSDVAFKKSRKITLQINFPLQNFIISVKEGWDTQNH